MPRAAWKRSSTNNAARGDRAARAADGPDMGPEAELLIDCARCVSPAADQRIRTACQQRIDWDHLLRKAARNSLGPLLYWRLESVCPDAAPPDVRAELRDCYSRNVRRNLCTTGEALRVVELLASHTIPAFVYKGPALACFAYENLGLRQFSDLDILVRKADVPRTDQALRSAGYAPKTGPGRLRQAYGLPFACAFALEFSYYRSDVDTSIDLHWDPTPRFFHAPIEHLWERLHTVPVAGRPTPTLSPEDLLLVLCAHGGKHLWASLGWICDIARLITVYPGMDWDWVMAQASTSGTRRAVHLGLALATELLGAEIPSRISGDISCDPVVKELISGIRPRLFAEGPVEPGTIANCRFYLKLRERAWDGMRSCIHVAAVPTQADWTAIALPRPLFPLYYVFRQFRLAASYSRAIWNRT